MNIMEAAEEMLEYWDGTMWARVIERDLQTDDLEALHYHVSQAEKERSIQETEFGDVY